MNVYALELELPGRSVTLTVSGRELLVFESFANAEAAAQGAVDAGVEVVKIGSPRELDELFAELARQELELSVFEDRYGELEVAEQATKAHELGYVIAALFLRGLALANQN